MGIFLDPPSVQRWNGVNMSQNSKITILVTYKNKHRLLKSNILTPIQSGRAIASETFDNMIGDDTGDNISSQNNIYSELSALYWAWKNYDKLGNPDYIGHTHYRRQFLFDISNLKLTKHWASSYYKFEIFTYKLLNAFSDNKIIKIVPNYDYLIPDWHNVSRFGHTNIREEYVKSIPGAKQEIFDEFIKICKEKAPLYREEIERIEKGTNVLICNMFIMKKELFFEYCEFVFPILAELVARIDTTNLTTNGQRFAGYMAEKLLSMFIMKLEKNKKLKEKILPCCYIMNPDKNKTKQILQSIFSVKNSAKNHKVITIAGIKLKFRKYIKKEMRNNE